MRLALRRSHRSVAGSDDAAVSTRLVRRSTAAIAVAAVVVMGRGGGGPVVQVDPRGGHVERPLELFELLQLHLRHDSICLLSVQGREINLIYSSGIWDKYIVRTGRAWWFDTTFSLL